MFDPHKYDDKCGQIYSVLTASGAKQPPQVHAGGAQKNLSICLPFSKVVFESLKMFLINLL